MRATALSARQDSREANWEDARQPRIRPAGKHEAWRPEVHEDKQLSAFFDFFDRRASCKEEG